MKYKLNQGSCCKERTAGWIRSAGQKGSFQNSHPLTASGTVRVGLETLPRLLQQHDPAAWQPRLRLDGHRRLGRGFRTALGSGAAAGAAARPPEPLHAAPSAPRLQRHDRAELRGCLWGSFLQLHLRRGCRWDSSFLGLRVSDVWENLS